MHRFDQKKKRFKTALVEKKIFLSFILFAAAEAYGDVSNVVKCYLKICQVSVLFYFILFYPYYYYYLLLWICDVTKHIFVRN